MTDEPRKVYLGTLDVEEGAAIAVDLPLDGDVDAIRNAIERANLERAAAAKCESERLKALFMPDAKKGTELS